MLKKALLLTIDFPPKKGGVARYLEAMTKILNSEISVVAAPEAGSDSFDLNAPFLVKRYSLLFKYFWPKWFKSVLFLIKEKNNYQTVIVSHVLPLGSAAYLAKFITKKPYIVIVHGMDVAMTRQLERKRRLARRVLCGAKVVITNSRALAEEIKKDFKIKNIEVIYPAIKTNCLSKNNQHFLSANNEFTLLTVSRLVQRKGHLRVLEALVKVKDTISNLHYNIVGDGPFLREIKKRAEELGLSSYVVFKTGLSDTELAKIYDEADIFVMPTVVDLIDREGFGTVYLEAAAHGLPAIATRQPGVAEAVLDNQTGLLIPDGDTEALAEAILGLWREPNERRRLGEAAKKRVQEEFTAEKQFIKLKKWL